MKRSPFTRRQNKYRAVKTTRDGILFDSKLESIVYGELQILQAGGLIKDMELQKEFVIEVNGKQICIYIADYFFTIVASGKRCVADAKGFLTDTFRLKWKLMQALYPQYQYEILKGKKLPGSFFK